MSSSTRNNPVALTVALTVAGLALAVVAIVYFAQPAGSLPQFFPGHTPGSHHHHVTHGIAAAIVGVVALAAAWMSSGRKVV